jgi:DNA ligase-1
VRFADLVAVSDQVKVLPARQQMVAQLAALLRERPPAEAATITELLLRSRLCAEADESGGRDEEAPVDEVGPVDHPVLTCEVIAGAFAEIDRISAAPFRRSLTNQLLSQATLDEQRWILRAIQHREFDRPTFDLIVSSAARGAYVSVNSIRRAATLSGSLPLAVRIAMERGEAGLQSVALVPGRPIPPTVAEVTEAPNVLLDPRRPAVLEWNLHADRVQVHRRRDSVLVFDQWLTDVTDLVPVVVEQVAALTRGDLVLDGWVDLNNSHQSDTRVAASWTRLSGAGLASGRALFCDVLFDGAPIVDEPLSVRRALLESIVPEGSRVPSLGFDDLDSIASAMNGSVELGHKGLVLKPLDDPYEGGLSKSGWRLIAPARVVRLAVLAADRGTGDRSHLLSTVHLGAHNDRTGFHQVGKTARGLTLETIVWQTGVFAELTLESDGGGSDNLFRLRPEVVAFVTIDGVEESDRYDVGLKLQRPSILGYQRGVGAAVTTVESLRDLARRNRVFDDPPTLPWLPPPPVTLPTLPSASNVAAAPDVATTDIASTPSTALRPVRSSYRSIDVEFEPYQEPPLSTSIRAWRSVMIARAAASIWVAAVLVAGLVERSGTGPVDGSAVVLSGRFGILVAATLVVTGWAWTDQLVRNTILLDGRKPSRARCVSAWLVPPVSVFVLAAVLVPAEPTQPADIRPVVIVGIFAIAMWRPYSLIRRILTTLTQVRSDVLIASAYIIDSFGLGLMWWRLALWEQRSEALSRGELDVLVGTMAAVAVAMPLGFVVWARLLASARDALAHRRASQRTRYEHRMLRLRGIDPSDPEVWWALVQRREDERRAAEAQLVAEAGHPAEQPDLRTVDALIENTRATHSMAFRRLDAEEAGRLETRLREQFTAIVGGVADVLEPDQQLDSPTAPAQLHGASSKGQPDAGPTLDEADVDPVEALRRNTGAPQRRTIERTTTPSQSDIETLLNRAGTLQIEAALAEHRKKLANDAQDDFAPPTLHPIEAARFAMVAAFGALALANAWLVTIALSFDVGAETGELSASAVKNLNLARKLFWGLFTSAAAVVPIWSLVMLRTARRAGIDTARERRVLLLAIVAVVACVGGFVFDASERSEVTLVLTIAIVWSALTSGLNVAPVRVWYELPASTLTSWVATLPMILGIAWLAGLAAPLEPTTSLQRLAFTTILLSLGCARVTVIAALSSIDLEDKFRTSPELAVPARARGRR